MRSSVGVIDAERRSATALAAVALAALALSLLLAFVSTLHRQPDRAVQRNTAAAPAATPAIAVTTAPTVAVTAAPPAAVAVAEPRNDAKPQPLWALLTPWAVTADVLAALGLAALLAVRRTARRRGARS